MKRRLLELGLLAYPRARRERDRDFLRDLALELAETQGFLRQVVSLVRGGLGERVESRRREAPGGQWRWIKRIALASFVIAAVGLAASAAIGPEGGGALVSDVDRFECVYATDPSSKRARVPQGGCGGTKRLVAERERGGWDCTTRRRTSYAKRATTWECTRGSDAVAWLGL
jgi:hypothetical protein